MVAPYEIGNPVRSFVRVPGSGTDKNAKALSWDLSRSSSVAAAAPVQQSYLPADPTTLLKQAASPAEDAGGSSEEGRGPEVPARTEGAGRNGPSAEPSARGRKRERTDEPGTEESPESVGPPPAKSVRVRLKSEEEGTTAAGTPASSDELAEAREERDQLRQENQELKARVGELDKLRQENVRLEERLTLFHDLFKNKNRLALLLRRLNLPQTSSSPH